MPGAAVGIGVGQCVGQSTVHSTTLLSRGITVDSGPNQRMPEFDPKIMHSDECRGLGGNQVGEVQPEHRRGASQHRHLAAVDGCREDEGVAGPLRKRPEAQEVNAADRALGSERRAWWQLGQPLAFLAKLKKRERVPTCLAVKAVREILAERLTPLVPQQLSRRGPVQALKAPGREVGAIEQRWLPLAHGQDDSDRIGDEATERKAQGIRARSVKPVRIVDQYCYRGHIRIAGEQAEGGRAYSEAALRASRPERERTLQRGRLRIWDLADPGQRRSQQLKQPGEGDMSLRLHPPRP